MDYLPKLESITLFYDPLRIKIIIHIKQYPMEQMANYGNLLSLLGHSVHSAVNTKLQMFLFITITCIQFMCCVNLDNLYSSCVE